MKRILTIIFMMMSTYVLADTPYDDWELTYESIIPDAEPSPVGFALLDTLRKQAVPLQYDETIITQASDGSLSLDVGETIYVSQDGNINGVIQGIITLINDDMFGEGITADTVEFNNTDGYISSKFSDLISALITLIQATNTLKQEYRISGEIFPYLDSYPEYLEAIYGLLAVINDYNEAIDNLDAYIATLTELQ